MALNQQPNYTETSERDNSVLLTSFPTEETCKDGPEVSSSIDHAHATFSPGFFCTFR